MKDNKTTAAKPAAKTGTAGKTPAKGAAKTPEMKGAKPAEKAQSKGKSGEKPDGEKEGSLAPLGVEKKKSREQERLMEIPAETLAKAIRQLLTEDMI